MPNPREAPTTDVSTSCHSLEAPSLLAINGGAYKERAEVATLVGASSGPIASSADSRTISVTKGVRMSGGKRGLGENSPSATSSSTAWGG